MKLKMTKDSLIKMYEAHHYKIGAKESKRLVRVYNKFVFWAWIKVHLAAFNGHRRARISLSVDELEVFKLCPMSRVFRARLEDEFKTYLVEFSWLLRCHDLDWLSREIIITWEVK